MDQGFFLLAAVFYNTAFGAKRTLAIPAILKEIQ
jgi:hypothetical protein